MMHLDTNSYGLAMSQYLPTGGFKWLNKKEIKNINLAKYKPERDKGLTLEVEFEYPKELHDSHNDYPFAAYKMFLKKCGPIIQKK